MQALPGNRIVTLRQVWTDYQESRTLKESTKKDYEKRLQRCLGDWLDKDIRSLSKDLIEEKHKELSKASPSQANLVMRILKALLTYASFKYDELAGLPNPVRRLSEVRAWNKVKRRQSMIHRHQMPAWFAAVLGLRNPTVRDYLLLLLFTGLRRNEGAQLLWRNVDLDRKIILIRDTKNHEDHCLPLPGYLVRVLEERKASAGKSIYVFPGKIANSHLSQWSKSHRHVVEASGVSFMLHDLRRTFCTTAKQIGIDFLVIKRLVNHKQKDTTEGYIVDDVEELREPMEDIANELLKRAGRAG